MSTTVTTAKNGYHKERRIIHLHRSCGVIYSKVVTVFIAAGVSIRASFVCARAVRGRENRSPASDRHTSLITTFINTTNIQQACSVIKLKMAITKHYNIKSRNKINERVVLVSRGNRK